MAKVAIGARVEPATQRTIRRIAYEYNVKQGQILDMLTEKFSGALETQLADKKTS